MDWKDLNGNYSNDTFALEHGKATKKGYEKRSKIISIEKLNLDLVKVSKSYNYIAAIIKCLDFHQLPCEAEKYVKFLEGEIDSFDKLELKSIY